MTETEFYGRLLGRAVEYVHHGVPCIVTEDIMGVREIKDSFNLVANPDATANQAFLDYKTQGNVQYQVLSFKGSWSDGEAFSILSDLIRPNGDPVLVARSTAAQLLERRGISR